MWLTMRSIRSAGLVGSRLAAAQVGALAELRQPLSEVLAHLAIGRVHRDQHPVEHREADRAGVDRLDACARAASPLARSDLLPTAARRRNTSRSYHDV